MHAIELRSLTKKYSNQTAVADLDLKVSVGELFGFVGPNGSGKTTTIRMIAGLLRPTSGEAFVAGYSAQDNPREVKRRIGYMPDEFGMYPDLKVWEYLDFFGSCYRIPEEKRASLISELLDLVELGHRRGDRVDSLSRGLKQRLSLARALIHDPEVLVLDEPASGLDPRARIEIRALMQELRRMGKTIFFSTHILPDVAEICTQVGILEAGTLVAVGRLDELHLQFMPRRRVHISILHHFSTAIDLLQNTPSITIIDAEPDPDTRGRARLVIDFSGNDTELSQVLNSLVKSEIPVLHFHEQETDLEEVFMRTTQGKVT